MADFLRSEILQVGILAGQPITTSGVKGHDGFFQLPRIKTGQSRPPSGLNAQPARELSGAALILFRSTRHRITGYAMMNSLVLQDTAVLQDSERESSAGLERVKKISLPAEQLTAENFAPFGDVIEVGDRESISSADGFLEAYPDLATLDITTRDGRPQISLLRATPRKLPLQIKTLERYHLSTRTIMPLLFYPFMIIVAPAGSTVDTSSLRAFVSDGQQGVNIGRGIWQHPLIALKRRMNFLTIDRAGPGRNREEIAVDGKLQVIAQI